MVYYQLGHQYIQEKARGPIQNPGGHHLSSSSSSFPSHSTLHADRVVFDASAKSKGFSLNEWMYKSPCITPLLFDVLIRFRL